MTIRSLHRWRRGDPDYEAVCVRCGEHIADFSNPESVCAAVEASGGEIVKAARSVTDCVAACADCADKCVCPTCGALLENNVCPNCPEFIQDDYQVIPVPVRDNGIVVMLPSEY